MPAPVAVETRVHDRRDPRHALRAHFARHDFADRGAFAVRVRVGVEEFLPHRPQVHEVLRLTEVFLRRLDLRQRGRLLQRAEQRMKRLARLEVNRAVLDLDEDVRTELSVEPGELDVGAFRPVGIDVFVVDERAPDDVSAVLSHGVAEHVGPLRVVPAVVLRARLPLGIGFDEKAAEVGDERVDLIRLVLPPRATPRSSGSAVFNPPSRTGAAKLADRYIRTP